MKRKRVGDDGEVVQALVERAPPPVRQWKQDRRFGVVIDAGSSGSRIQVYSWLDHEVAKEQRTARGDGIAVLPRVEKGVEQGEGWTMKVEPGISSLADNPEGTDEYLRPLFDHARAIIPQNQLSSTPVFLLATAGMRLLPEYKSRAILDQACRYIRHGTPFGIDDCENQIRIISGEEEGVYGWVAINYLMDGFDAHGISDKGKGRHSSTYGFLDMGGASTQIAFEPATLARKEHADNLLSVNLRLLDGMDVHHPVFVTTWLGYGTNQARERYVEAILSQYVRDHPQDAASSASVGQEKPMIIVSDPCLPSSLLLTEQRHPGYALQGTGDFSACITQSAPLLNKELPCPDEPCLMGVHVPPIDFQVNHFIGISEYWYSTQELWSLGGVYDFPTFEKSAIEYCSRNWEDIVKDHAEGGSRWKAGHKADVSRLEMQCFKAAWIVNVLHDGIGIPRLSIDAGGSGGSSNGTEEALKKAGQKGFAEGPAKFQSVNEINNVAVSWTLGRMVLEVTDSIKRSSKSPAHDDDDDALTPMFEWKTGHAKSSWLGRIGRQSRGRPFSLSLLAFLLLAFALYYFACSAKRKSSFYARIFGRSRPGREDYGLVSMEEGDHTLSDDVQDVPSPSRQLRKTSNPGLRILHNLRLLASRLTRGGGSTGSFLPVTHQSLPSSPSGRNSDLPPIRPTRNLRHVNSSPAIFRITPSPTKSQRRGGSAPKARSKMQIEFMPDEGDGLEQYDGAITPPTESHVWPGMRTTPSSTRSNGTSSRTVSRQSSNKSLHRAARAGGSSSESESYLALPVGVSSASPMISPQGGLDMNGEALGLSATKLGDGEARIGLRSRNSSYTNLGALARNRGGHARQVSSSDMA